MHEADALLSGDEGPAGNLNVQVDAVAAEEERTLKKQRQKQKATTKTAVKSREEIPETESDGEKPVSKKRRKDSESKGTVRARVSAGKGRKKKEVVDVDASGDEGESASNSRHLSVTVSQIYKDWNGELLDLTRRRFQSLILARDGATLKSQAPANAMTFKLVLKAAQAVMQAKEYASFSAQMERAYQSKEKA